MATWLYEDYELQKMLQNAQMQFDFQKKLKQLFFFVYTI